MSHQTNLFRRNVGLETGPGAIITGAVGAMVFGTAGYFGADWIADFIYEN